MIQKKPSRLDPPVLGLQYDVAEFVLGNESIFTCQNGWDHKKSIPVWDFA